MTTHPGRYIGLCLLLLTFSAVAPTAAEWVRTKVRLPAGYGAAGDRRQANPIPALIRQTVDELTAGVDGSGVKECVKGGAWVYEVHLVKNDQSSVIRLSSNGYAIQSEAPEPDSNLVTAAGE